MIHAILNGKCSEYTPELQRREDMLTSVCFGMLVHAQRADIVSQWLLGKNVGSAEIRAWFWPRIGNVEPDVVVSIGEHVCVIEAKFASGRHDTAVRDDEEVAAGDQLFRQVESINRVHRAKLEGIREVDRALQRCEPIHIYLVDANRRARADREFLESFSRLVQADQHRLKMCTWQQLWPLIAEPNVAWQSDLRAYLELCELRPFQGHWLPPGPRTHERVLGWKQDRKPYRWDFHRVATTHPLTTWSIQRRLQ